MLGVHGRQGGRCRQKYNYKHRDQKYRIIKGEKRLRTGRHGGSCNQGQKKTNSGNRVAAVEQPSEKGDKLGIHGGCSQKQLKKDIKEGEKLA